MNQWRASAGAMLALVSLLIGSCTAARPPHLGLGADLGSIRALERSMERADDRVRELQQAALQVLAVKRLYEGEAGGTARVVIMDTDQGEKLAKISYVRTVSNRVVPWILQDEASRAGLAPALHKIIEGPQLTTLFREQPVLRDLTSPWSHSPQSSPISMVVMDVVHDGFSFLQWARSKRKLDRYSARMLPLWTERLAVIEAFLNRHNIQMADEQFLIQPDGGLMAIDFDHYTFVDTRNRRWAYKGVTDYPDVAYWKTPTPDAKLNDLASAIETLHALIASRP